MIVLNIMDELVDNAIGHGFHYARRPIDVLKQYRRLLLTCKTFYDIIQNHETKLSMIIDVVDTKFDVLRGRECDTFDYDEVEGYSSTFDRISSFFMSWQLEVLTCRRKIYSNEETSPSAYIYPQRQELGNFHLNPKLNLHYIWRFQWSDIYPRVLLLLSPFLERNAKKVDTFPGGEKGSNGFSIGDYSHEGTVRCIDHPIWQYSIENWWHIDDPSINGFQVCDEVKEWWVWENWSIDQIYFSGYVEDKAWVFDATQGIVYTTFGLPKEIGDRLLFLDIHDLNCVHCGSEL
jgi:hypothetical protein